jgi:arabinofuranan 3-O-arabinosyltransferase
MTVTEPITQPIPAVDGGDPGEPGVRRSAETGPPGDPAASRWWLLLVLVVAFVAFASHDVGQLTFDTKLGVDIDPAGFYQRLFSLWNPLEWFGGLQDQYIGYAFPMAAFYLVGHLIQLPVWLIERLWMTLLVTAGFWGVVRLAESLRIGTTRSRLVAAAVFALWPTYTVLIGSTSVAVLPGLLAPWAVLPLVAGARGGSARLAAARSGVAVLAMGGVNAVSTMAALTLPALYILTRPQARRRASLLLWWLAAVVLATLWWLVPLVFQKAYGFDFLPYIEQAANTTQTMSASAVLRGSGNWVAYLHFGTAWLSAGWAVVSMPVTIAAATVAAATGLYGLARRDLPEGRWLRCAAGLAALVMLAGYAGPAGGLFSGTVQHLLDGALAPLRNIYKFEPALAGTLALGVAHALTPLPDRKSLRWKGFRSANRWAPVALVAAVLAGLGLPYLSGQVLQPGSFASVPSYWTDTARFLAAHSPTEPALVTPADSHGTYVWGDPIDEPLEPLASSPWVERGLVPFSGAGAQSVVDTAEQALESGTAVPGLGAFLARAGIRYVVVRNDLDPTQIDYTPPRLVHRTLQQSGFTRVASFGPSTTGGYIYPNTPLALQAMLTSYPAVEVYQAPVEPTPFGPVTALPATSTMQVDGDPGSLLQLTGQGLLGGQPVVMAGDGDAAPSSDAVTDGARRQDDAFGLIQHNASYTYTATGTNPADDPHGDDGGPPRQLPTTGPGQQTVAEFSGAADVTASSYGSWFWELPEYDPVNAFDGNPGTAWVEGRPDSGVGQWVQITFDHPIDLPASVPIQLLDDSTFRPLITQAVTTTDAGGATTKLAATGAAQPLRVPPGRTSTLRITIAATSGGIAGGPGAGITGVRIPGVTVTRFLRPAEDDAVDTARSVSFSFHRDTNSPLSLATAQPEPQLARMFTTGVPRDLRMSASAVAVPGSALDALLDRYRSKASSLRISASSTWGSLPQFRASNLLDGDFTTGWVAGSADPVLHLSWTGARSIDQVVLVPAGGLSTAPATVHIDSPDGSRDATVGPDGTVRFPALSTDRMDISFPKLRATSTFNPVVGQPMPLLAGLAELYVPALRDLLAPPPDPSTPVTLPCGQGPAVNLDGHGYQTSARTTVGDLSSFQPVTVNLCAPNGTVHLDTGLHRLTSPGSPGPLAITDLALTNQGSSTSAPARTVRVGEWQPEHRTVTVGAGDNAYLEVHQAFDAGWTATLNGQQLRSVRLDGWQQGFVLPEGSGGTVTLSFTPGTTYRQVVAGSVGGVGLLAVGAVIPGRVRRPRKDPTSRGGTGTIGRWTALAAVTVLFVVIGGIAAVLVPIMAALGYLRPKWMPAIAAIMMLGAGVCTVVGVVQHGVAAGYGAFGAPAQVFALAALAAVLVPRLSQAEAEGGRDSG